MEKHNFPTFGSWYPSDMHSTAVSSTTSISASSQTAADGIAHQAFIAAATRFAFKLERNGNKDEVLRNSTSMQSVQALIEKSKKKYEDEKKFPKARKWLLRATSVIQYYSSVIDVFAQISPEYVSLVWGSMRLVVTAAQNHHDTISLFSKALAQIGDALSRVEVVTNLYPTTRMRVAVEELYGNIFEFLARAHRWYQEGWGRHLWHSITQPPKLKYKDLVEDISESSNRIRELSGLETQVEIREMNRKLTDMVATLAIHSSALVNTDRRLTDLQFSSIMSFLLEDALGDAMRSYQYNQSTRDRTRGTSLQGLTNSFWLSPKLHHWSSAEESKLVFIRGSAKVQPIMRTFCIKVIDQLRDNNIPVLWALPSAQGDGSDKKGSPVDILKHLIMQAMQYSKGAPRESEVTRLCTRFKTMRTEMEWMRLLVQALRSIGPLCYLIIDLSTRDQGLQPIESGFSWLGAFQELFSQLATGVPSIRVKVLLLNSWPGWDRSLLEASDIPTDLLIPVRLPLIPDKKRKRIELQQNSRNRVKGLRTLSLQGR